MSDPGPGPSSDFGEDIDVFTDADALRDCLSRVGVSQWLGVVKLRPYDHMWMNPGVGGSTAAKMVHEGSAHFGNQSLDTERYG